MRPVMDILAAGAEKMGFPLSRWQLSQFERYYRELITWNEDINLTRITGYEDVQVRHFLDSLTCLPVMGTQEHMENKRVLDVGAGAGFPGLPLGIYAPEMRLTLLEATNKKVAFLKEMVSILGLRNVEILSGRAEELGHDPVYRESYDFVLARAVAALPALAELMLPLCAVGGKCIAHKKGDVAEEVRTAEKAISVLGGRVESIRSVKLLPEENDRALVVMEKTGPAPGEYPRRPGIPVKRPIL